MKSHSSKSHNNLNQEKSSEEESYRILKLSKDNLKFSAAHFLIFDDKHAERLHGHNYQVQVEYFWKNSELKKNPYGFYVDFKSLKKIVHKTLQMWDEYFLIPQDCPDMKIKTKGKSLVIDFRDRHYEIPRDEVVLLPIVNTSVELLSQLMCDKLWQQSQIYNPSGLKVLIEETRGQGAWSIRGQF